MFFFKQKTAYEMRISDWSSDVCSSDLNMVDPTRTLSGAPTYSAFSGLMTLGNTMMYTAVGLFATGVALDVISLASDLLPAKFGLSMASKVAGTVLSVSNKLHGNPNSGLGGLVSKYRSEEHTSEIQPPM